MGIGVSVSGGDGKGGSLARVVAWKFFLALCGFALLRMFEARF